MEKQISSVTTYQQCITRNNKGRKLHTLQSQKNKVFRNQTTQVKWQKKIVYLMQGKLVKKPPPFKNNEDYIGDTNEKTYGSDDSPSESDVYARNLGEEHENEEDE